MRTAKILVIEVSESEIDVLDQLGETYELEVLNDGEEALRFVQEHRTRMREPEPCVILLDLYLPRYGGMAVLRAIRQAARAGAYSRRGINGTANPRSAGRNCKPRSCV